MPSTNRTFTKTATIRDCFGFISEQIFLKQQNEIGPILSAKDFRLRRISGCKSEQKTVHSFDHQETQQEHPSELKDRKQDEDVHLDQGSETTIQ